MKVLVGKSALLPTPVSFNLRAFHRRVRMEEKDIVLTDEMRELISKSGSFGYQIDSEFPYVPKIFREKNGKKEYTFPKSLWPVFKLKTIDGVAAAELEDMQRGDFKYETVTDNEVKGMSMKLHSAKARIETLRRCLISWKNFRNIKGEIIPDCKKDNLYDGASENSLRYIPPDLQVELVNAVESQIVLTEEELLGLEL